MEEWDDYIANLRESALGQGFELVQDENNPDKYRIADITTKVGNQFVIKPKIKKERIGTIIFKSREYVFTETGTERGSYGDIPGASNFTDNGFIVTYGDATYNYELV